MQIGPIRPPPFRSNCEEGDEELSEPNNTAQEAVRVEPGHLKAASVTKTWTFIDLPFLGLGGPH